MSRLGEYFVFKLNGTLLWNLVIISQKMGRFVGLTKVVQIDAAFFIQHFASLVQFD